MVIFGIKDATDLIPMIQELKHNVRMTPATVDGKPDNLRYSIPINFQLK